MARISIDRDLVNLPSRRIKRDKTRDARPVVIIVGRPEWIASCAGEFGRVEVFDTGGQLKYVTSKTGGGR